MIGGADRCQLSDLSKFRLSLHRTIQEPLTRPSATLSPPSRPDRRRGEGQQLAHHLIVERGNNSRITGLLPFSPPGVGWDGGEKVPLTRSEAKGKGRMRGPTAKRQPPIWTALTRDQGPGTRNR